MTDIGGKIGKSMENVWELISTEISITDGTAHVRYYTVNTY